MTHSLATGISGGAGPGHKLGLFALTEKGGSVHVSLTKYEAAYIWLHMQQSDMFADARSLAENAGSLKAIRLLAEAERARRGA